MYYRNLKVALFGIDDEIVQALESVEAPPRFEFEFVQAKSVDIGIARECSVVIANGDAFGQASLKDVSDAAREGIGFGGIVLLASDTQANELTSEDLALIDALWITPLSPQRAAFEFSGIVKHAKHHADMYITGAYLDTLIDSMPDMVWFKALDGEHVKVNRYFCSIVDKTREDVTGQFHNYIWSVPEKDWENAELTCKESDEAAIKAGTTRRCEENVSTHGEIRLFDTYKTPIYDEDGTVLGTSGFAADITVERELERLAWLNARTDYLTGLYNRRYFYEFLDEHADEGPMTFVLIDLDNFKDINDDNGHDEGDNALLVTTAALHKSFPECPIVRWGGDEFIAVIPKALENLASDENIEAFQKTINEWTGEKCPVALTTSIGIAEQAEGDTVDDMVKKADELLYQAKSAGKSCHRRYA